eukprot:366039-Chlamydomonas_euryale.AAC.13
MRRHKSIFPTPRQTGQKYFVVARPTDSAPLRILVDKHRHAVRVAGLAWVARDLAPPTLRAELLRLRRRAPRVAPQALCLWEVALGAIALRLLSRKRGTRRGGERALHGRVAHLWLHLRSRSVRGLSRRGLFADFEVSAGGMRQEGPLMGKGQGGTRVDETPRCSSGEGREGLL